MSRKSASIHWIKYAAIIFISVWGMIPSGNAETEHDFVGAKKCSMCHKSPAQGEQYSKWQTSGHAKAFEVLGTDAAKAAASKAGVPDAQKSGKCLKCHSTAYGNMEAQMTQNIPVEEGISCESCHGAGKDYMKMSVMKDLRAAAAAGLKLPDEKTCVTCHNAESPTFKPFSYAERVETIKHSIPKK